MTKPSLKRTDIGKVRGTGWLVLGAVAMAVLTACGGGQESALDSAAAAELAPDGALTAEHGVSAANPTVLAVGERGFVGKALALTHTAATDGNFDVLVVGDADKIDAATKARIELALESGKQVVLDGPSDGSSRAAHKEMLREITGMTLDAAAVRIQRDPQGKGYYVTPIDSVAPSKARKSTAQAGGQTGEGESESESESDNTVAGIFGSGSDE